MSEPKIRLGQISPSSTGTDQLSGNVALAGNLTFSGTGLRILGDLSSTPIANRLSFQNSLANTASVVGVIPNGTSNTSRFAVWNSSSPDNSSWGDLSASATEISIRSNQAGSGSYLPLTFYTGGSERMRLDTSGNLGIGGTALAFSRVQVTGTLPSGSSASVAHYVNATVPSTSTNNFQGFRTDISTEAAAFTVANGYHFYAARGTIGAGSAITNQYGFYVDGSIIGATNNYGVYSGINSGSNRWNFYAVGTAANYFAGDTGIGTTTIPARFTVQGAGTSTTVGGNIVSRFQTNGSGYDASIQLSDNVTNSAILSMLAGNISLISNGTNYFYINSSGLVGLNTTSPASQLQVNSTTEWGVRLRYASDTTTNRATFLSQRARGSLASPTAATSGTIVGGIEGAGYTGAAYTSGYDGGAAIQFIAESNWASANTPTFMSFWTNAVGAAGYSERMRITAAGAVGIGITSPGAKLDVYGDSRFGGTVSAGRRLDIDSNGIATFKFGNNGYNTIAYFDNISDAGATTNHGTNLLWRFGTNTDTSTAINAGRIGVLKEQQWTSTASTQDSFMEFATTADGNIAERMRITSAGNVGIGAAPPDANHRLHVVNTGAKHGIFAQIDDTAYYCQQNWNSAGSGDNKFASFLTDVGATLRGSIDYNRAGGQVRYNTTSDYRAKDVYGAWDDSGATIDALKVYRGKMHGATQERPMMIAHEAQAVVPYAVGGEKDAVDKDGKPVYQTMDHQILVPLLIAELQAVRARLAALENK